MQERRLLKPDWYINFLKRRRVFEKPEPKVQGISHLSQPFQDYIITRYGSFPAFKEKSDEIGYKKIEGQFYSWRWHNGHEYREHTLATNSFFDPENQARWNQAHKETMRKKWQEPAYKQIHLITIPFFDPDAISAQSKLNWEDDEYRDKQYANNPAFNPDYASKKFKKIWRENDETALQKHSDDMKRAATERWTNDRDKRLAGNEKWQVKRDLKPHFWQQEGYECRGAGKVDGICGRWYGSWPR